MVVKSGNTLFTESAIISMIRGNYIHRPGERKTQILNLKSGISDDGVNSTVFIFAAHNFTHVFHFSWFAAFVLQIGIIIISNKLYNFYFKFSK